ncbi:MAG: hypothetical protein GY820_26305 [Gammaproteobacteria bacterium]|nr:hypothetical protein [Gammaproteobacteria bacterium]
MAEAFTAHSAVEAWFPGHNRPPCLEAGKSISRFMRCTYELNSGIIIEQTSLV